MKDSLLLLPNPRRIELTGQSLILKNQREIVLTGDTAEKLRFSAKRFQNALKKQIDLDWQISAGQDVQAESMGLLLEIDSNCEGGEQGCCLQIESDRIMIRSKGAAGIFYGVSTLIQIIEQCGAVIPCLRIDDSPDFPARGVMLDISRDKVPTMETLFYLIDLLASWKINQIQLYTEHTFAYQNHPDVWRDASPVTAQEVKELDAYCRQRYIDLVPNQNSFGHLTKWLKLPAYAPLAETHGLFDAPWGKVQGPFSLSPANPGSLQLIRSLFDELLPNFSSRMVNVGCDETFDIGVGQSKEICIERGADRVMFEYLLDLYQDIKKRGLIMQFWADILVHHRQLLSEMPKDAIALIWIYESVDSFEEQAAIFENAGMPYYVCPGTSSWNSLGGRTLNALANNLDAARSGHYRGAQGYLNTDWGDNGHWQVLPISLPGFAAGAAYSWCVDSNQDAQVDDMVSLHGFGDPSGVMGKVLSTLGNVYLETGIQLPNSSALFWLMQYPLDVLRNLGQISPDRVSACLTAVQGALTELENEKMTCPDRQLVVREVQLAAKMMRHACYRAQLLNENDPAAQTRLINRLKTDIEDWLVEYRRLWLERNRPGGLQDSQSRLERLLEEYNRLER